MFARTSYEGESRVSLKGRFKGAHIGVRYKGFGLRSFCREDNDFGDKGLKIIKMFYYRI